jgi:hypothetical protein
VAIAGWRDEEKGENDGAVENGRRTPELNSWRCNSLDGHLGMLEVSPSAAAQTGGEDGMG